MNIKCICMFWVNSEQQTHQIRKGGDGVSDVHTVKHNWSWITLDFVFPAWFQRRTAFKPATFYPSIFVNALCVFKDNMLWYRHLTGLIWNQFLFLCLLPFVVLFSYFYSAWRDDVRRNRSVSHSEVQWEVLDVYFLAICNCHSILFVFVCYFEVQLLSLPPNLTGNIFNVILVLSQASTLLLLNSLGSHVSVCNQVHVDVTICKLRMNSITSVFFTLTEMILLFFFLSGFVAWHLQNSIAFLSFFCASCFFTASPGPGGFGCLLNV